MIVLLSDGENNERPDPVAAAQTAADQGVHIDTVGIGSPDGTTLDINGFRVHTALNEDLLKQIAYDDRRRPTSRPPTSTICSRSTTNLGQHLVVKPEPMEVTSLFAAGGVVLLLLGGLLSLRWLGRVL